MPKGGRVQVWQEVDATDDYDGSPLSEEDGQDVTLQYEGNRYNLFLSKANADKFSEVIGDWTKNVQPTPSTAFRPAGIPSGPGVSAEERKALMAWSRDTDGIPAVAERGRVKVSTLEAWEKAGKPGFGAPAGDS